MPAVEWEARVERRLLLVDSARKDRPNSALLCGRQAAAVARAGAGGHIAIEVESAYATCERIKAAGGTVTRDAGPVKGGITVIAFVQDPDGYKIELIERARSQ